MNVAGITAIRHAHTNAQDDLVRARLQLTHELQMPSHRNPDAIRSHDVKVDRLTKYVTDQAALVDDLATALREAQGIS